MQDRQRGMKKVMRAKKMISRSSQHPPKQKGKYPNKQALRRRKGYSEHALLNL
jgi:hypothetical protein